MAPLTAAQERFAEAVVELEERRRRRAAERFWASIIWGAAAVAVATLFSL